MKPKKYKYTNKVDKSVWILVFGSAVTSLVIDRKAFDPFNTIKLISILLISSWLLGHLINSYRKEPIKLKSNSAFDLIICIVFVIAFVISAYFSDNLVLAAVGDVFRRNGFLQYLALTIILLFASRSMDYKNSILIYKMSIFTSLIMASYGLFQITGNDFFEWNNPYNSMISTVGNPNFASALLSVFFLMCLSAIFIDRISVKIKIAAFLSSIICLVDIVESESRQGLVTIALGILFYISVYSYLNRRSIGIVIGVISICILITGIAGMLQRGPLSKLLYKDSVSVRGYYWRAAIEMFLNKPLTGIGIDNYGANFKYFREVAYPLKYGSEITSSNAHNTILQFFGTGGIFVGLAYVFLLVYVLCVGIKLIKQTNKNEQKIALGLLSSWIAFQAQTVISIDNIGVSIWGWLLGGSIIGLARNSNKSLNSSNNNLISNGSRSVALFQPIVSSFCLILTSVFSYYLIQSERDLQLAANYTNPNILENRSIVEFYGKQVVNNPFALNFYKLQAANYIYAMGDTDYGYKTIQELHNIDQNNLDILKSMLQIEKIKDNKLKLVEIREKIVKRDPWNVDNYYELFLLNQELGKVGEAEKYKSKIMKIAPNSEASRKIQNS